MFGRRKNCLVSFFFNPTTVVVERTSRPTSSWRAPVRDLFDGCVRQLFSEVTDWLNSSAVFFAWTCARWLCLRQARFKRKRNESWGKNFHPALASMSTLEECTAISSLSRSLTLRVSFYLLSPSWCPSTHYPSYRSLSLSLSLSRSLSLTELRFHRTANSKSFLRGKNVPQVSVKRKKNSGFEKIPSIRPVSKFCSINFLANISDSNFWAWVNFHLKAVV